MDAENEIARAKWLLVAFFVFLASGCISWNEVTYLISGKTIDANVTGFSDVTRNGRLGTVEKRRLADYAFTEPDGTHRKGSGGVALDWTPPTSGKIAVQYTPGADGDSRLAGHVNWVGPSLFAVSLTLMGVFGYRLWCEASDATSDRKPKRK